MTTALTADDAAQAWLAATPGGWIMLAGRCKTPDRHPAHTFTWNTRDGRSSGWSCPGVDVDCVSCDDRRCLPCRDCPPARMIRGQAGAAELAERLEKVISEAASDTSTADGCRLAALAVLAELGLVARPF